MRQTSATSLPNIIYIIFFTPSFMSSLCTLQVDVCIITLPPPVPPLHRTHIPPHTRVGRFLLRNLRWSCMLTLEAWTTGRFALDKHLVTFFVCLSCLVYNLLPIYFLALLSTFSSSPLPPHHSTHIRHAHAFYTHTHHSHTQHFISGFFPLRFFHFIIYIYIYTVYTCTVYTCTVYMYCIYLLYIICTVYNIYWNAYHH